MSEAACDSLLGCLGVVADGASVALHLVASCVGLLLTALDGAWRLVSLAASVVTAVLGAASAAAWAVGEFAVDVGHLLVGCVKFAVFLVLSAANGVHLIAGALEVLLTAMGTAAASAWHFAGRAADGWASVPRWAAESAKIADVRAFESTHWFLEKLAEALAVAASCVAQSVVGALRFAMALPRDTVVWVESLVEQCVAAAWGALLGVGRAVAVLLTDGAYSAAMDAMKHQASRADGTWSSMCDDWPSKLLVCAAIACLVFASVAERHIRHVWWRRNGDQDDSEYDSENDGNDDHVRAGNAASDPASSSRPNGSPSAGAGDVSPAGDGANQTGSVLSQTIGATSQAGGARHSTEQAELLRPPGRSSSTTSDPRDECSSSGGGDDDGLSAAVRQLQEQLYAERDKQLCVVCQHSAKSVLLLPCRHLCVCPECAQRITTRWLRRERACPLCRTEITDAVEAYT